MLGGDIEMKKKILNWAWRDSKNMRHSFSRKVSGSGGDEKNDYLIP